MLGARVGANLIEERDLTERGWVTIVVKEPIRLIDLTGPGLAAMGVDGRLLTCAHDLSRPWGQRMWEAAGTFDGIAYPALHNLSTISIALFDRAEAKIGIVETHRNLTTHSEIGHLLREYRLAIA